LIIFTLVSDNLEKDYQVGRNQSESESDSDGIFILANSQKKTLNADLTKIKETTITKKKKAKLRNQFDESKLKNITSFYVNQFNSDTNQSLTKV
jgi:hypothetical protein